MVKETGKKENRTLGEVFRCSTDNYAGREFFAD